MIKIRWGELDKWETINITKFPDNSHKINIEHLTFALSNSLEIMWLYENDEELVSLIYITQHIKNIVKLPRIILIMPYIPNARMDRVKSCKEVFTLKYFTNVINWLGFDKVKVFDPHSHVSEALINNIVILEPTHYIYKIINKIESKNLILYFPDEGAMKRYSDISKEFNIPYTFGIKNRDWSTGEIIDLQVQECGNSLKNKDILIIDDICSKGGTFYYSAKKLKELGVNNIYLYVSHCENTILQGDILTSGLINKVFTTNSIFTENHERIEVLKIW